jgi:hypothetical protein
MRRNTWVLELEDLELDLALTLAAEMPDQLFVVVEVALARLTALRAVARVLIQTLVPAASHVLLADGEAAAEDATDGALALALLDLSAGTSVLHLA